LRDVLIRANPYATVVVGAIDCGMRKQEVVSMRHAVRQENETPTNRPLAALYAILALLFVFAGLLVAVVVIVVVGLGRAIDWVGIHLSVIVLLGVFVGMFVLFVREGGKVYAKVYDELYKHPS
jgi:C4-dicarboxylate transporter